ncbi:MAG TPA: hypothetical protein VIY73_24630 [Polyangiaceae bacterium]
MGIRICSGEGATYLYESCGMRPVNTESFRDEEEAEDFIALAAMRGVAIGGADAATLDRLQDELREMPECTDCGDRVFDAEAPKPARCGRCTRLAEYDASVEAELAS